MFKSVLKNVVVLCMGILFLFWLPKEIWIGILVIVYAICNFVVDVIEYFQSRKMK